MISTSTFYSLSGEQYVLNITGTNVVSRTLVLAANEPVIISYSKPQVKFSGLRTVTCKIKIIANENMSDLCASTATENKVEILHTVNGSQVPVFSGYIIPFQYNTPYTLNNDVIEIEAIDLISACKYKYWTWAEAQTALSPLGFLSRICYPLGITKIIKNDNFGVKNNSAAICDNLTDTTIPTQAFLPENFTDEPNVPLPEVISSISQFFGYIALNLGNTLYLFDPHCLINGYQNQKFNASVYTLTSETAYTVSRTWGLNSILHNPVTITAEDFCDTDTTFSVEQPYGKIFVTMKDTGVYMLLPDILKNAKMYDDAFIWGDETSGFETTAFYMSSLLKLDAVNWALKDSQNNIILNPETTNIVTAFQSIYSTPILFCGAYGSIFRRYSINDGSPSYQEDKAIVFQHPSYSGIWIENIFQIKDLYVGYMLSNMKFSISGQIESVNSQKPFPSTYVTGQTPISGPQPIMGLKIGYKDMSKCYFYGVSTDPSTPGEWYEYDLDSILVEDAPVLFGTANQTSRKNNQAKGQLGDMTDPGAWKDVNIAHSGSMVIFLQAFSISGGRTYFIFNLEIKLRGFSLEDKKDSLTVVLNSDNNENLNVDTGLLCLSDTNLKRVLISDTLKGNYCSLAYDYTSPTPFTGVLMTQLAARYAVKREAFEMSVSCDVKPWSVVTFDGKNFTVDAMEWNLANDEKRILIN